MSRVVLEIYLSHIFLIREIHQKPCQQPVESQARHPDPCTQLKTKCDLLEFWMNQTWTCWKKPKHMHGDGENIKCQVADQSHVQHGSNSKHKARQNLAIAAGMQKQWLKCYFGPQNILHSDLNWGITLFPFRTIWPVGHLLIVTWAECRSQPKLGNSTNTSATAKELLKSLLDPFSQPFHSACPVYASIVPKETSQFINMKIE